ncbi:MAG: hypothetical protein HRF49_08330 [bacterium]|jgi:hypothetical protein
MKRSKSNDYFLALFAFAAMLCASCGGGGGPAPGPGPQPGPSYPQGITNFGISPARASYFSGEILTIGVRAVALDGGTLSYAWSLGGWAEIQGDPAKDAIQAKLVGEPGSYKGSVTVTEVREGKTPRTAYWEFFVTISGTMPAPELSGVSAAPSKDVYYFGEAVTFSAVGAEPNSGGELTYEWDFGEWGGSDSNPTNAVEAVSLLRAAGDFVCTLTVIETTLGHAQTTASAEIAIRIEEPPSGAPIVSEVRLEGGMLVATYSDPDGDAVSVAWEADAGCVFPKSETANEARARFLPWLAPGPSRVTATVTDEFGLSDSETITVLYDKELANPIAEDSLFIWPQKLLVEAGEEIYVALFVNGNEQPIAGFNIRIIVNRDLASGAYILEPPPNDPGYAYPMAAYPAFWLPPPLYPQPEYVDLRVDFNEFQQVLFGPGSQGCLAFAAFRIGEELTPGTEISFDLDAANTYYWDTLENEYAFGALGKDYDGNGSVESEVVMRVR